MSMKEDRAREGKKAKYRKIGLGPAMDRGDIDFGDKHPLTKKRLKNFKKKENPMADERFYQTAKKRLMGYGISANKIGKYNDTPNKFDASRIAKKVGGGMSAGQAKIAAKAPPPNKIDAKDFAVLRQEKARGRGMGLQDEKVKPGKVMKARVGRSVTRIPLAGKSTSVGSTTMKGMKFSDKAKMVDAGKINKATGKFTSMEALRESVGYRPGESTSEFKKRRMKLAGAAQALKASRIGKIALGVAAAGLGAKKYLESKMKKKKDVKKKMSGGMMKPKGYNHGGGIEIDTDIMGKRFDKKFAKHALSKDSQFHAKDYDAGIDIGEKRAMNEVMQESGLKFSEKPKVKARDKRKPRAQIQRERERRTRRNRRISSSTNSMGGMPYRNMGGMMMQRPMGYKHGTEPGAGPLGGIGKAGRQASPSQPPKKKEKPTPIILKFGVKEGPAKQNTTIKTFELKNRKDLKKTLSSRMSGGMMKKYSKGGAMKKGYMGGGMMKPMGYKSGTFVKARGCKLGRTRPTKIT